MLTKNYSNLYFMTISERITEARKARSHSRKDLAQAVGVSSAAITQWESGETKSIAAENLLKAAHFLKVRPDWLVFGTGQMDISTQATDINLELINDIIYHIKDKRSDLSARDFADLCTSIYSYIQAEEVPEEQQDSKIINLTKIFGKVS